MLRIAAILLVALPVLADEDDAPKKPKAKEPETAIGKAHQRWLRGNYDEARGQYEKLLAIEADRTAAAIGKARTYQSQGEHAKALAGLAAAIKKDPKSAPLLAAQADALYRTGQWADARKAADAALNIDPDNFLARWVRAQHLRDTGDLTKGYEEMRWFVRTYTARDNADKPITNPDELLLVGLAGAEHARWNSLAQQFRFLINDLYSDVLKFDPDDWRAEHAIGTLLLEKYNRPEANEAFNNALKVNPRAAEAHVGKGQVALQQFEMKEAEGHADQALKINPNLVSALRLKADVLILGGDIANARKLLNKAKEVNPRDESTLARLAACARIQNEPEVVNGLIAEVEKFNTKPGVFYHELGSALDDRKIYRDAETYFKKSIELREKLPAPRASLGMLYMRLGNEAEARKHLDLAFKGDSFNVRVSNTRKVLDHLSKYNTIKTAHFDLKYNPKTDQVLAEFLAEYLEEIYAELKKDFAYEPEGRVLIELFDNHEMFSGRTVGLPDLHTIGACTGRVVTMASPKGKGIAKPFNWGRVIRHELVHIFNLAQTDFLVPHWMTEGLAVRKEGGNRPPSWNVVLRERFEKNDLLNLDNILLAFVRPRSQEEWSLAYCQSNIYVEYIIKTYGIETLGPLLNAFRDGLDTAAALKKVCKVEKADFEAAYKAHVAEIVKSIPSAGRKAADAKPMTLSELEKAHEKSPDDADLAARLADQYSRRKNAKKAREMADKVLDRKPGHPMASIVKARLLKLAGDDDAAMLVIDAAVKSNPDDPRLILTLGQMALEAKDLPKAAELFERGRKIAPLDGDWLNNLILIYKELGKGDKLRDVLAEQVANDPDDLTNRIRLARMYLEAKKFIDAERVAMDGMRIDVTSKEAQKALVEALEGQDKGEAVGKLKRRFGEE